MANEHTGDWSLTHRLLFRFTALYWILYCIPQFGCASLVDILPWGSEKLSGWMAWPLQQPSLWLGTHVFHLQGEAATFHPTGSGDTALDYVLVLVIAVLAVLGTVVWSLLDRKRKQYRTFDAWLRMILSFVLAAAMLSYGFAKVFPGQFGQPGLGQLTETYGESSPMGILWVFMGVSRWYTMFGGFAEVVPGLLLLFRRTRTIGALLAAAVLTNIVALNFFYDVPVKIYSSHLLLLSLFLAGPDLLALAKLFFLRRQIQLRTDHVPASERKWLRRTGNAMQAIVVIAALYTQGYSNYQPYTVPDRTMPLYGAWQLQHATSTVAMTPWERIIVQRKSSITVRTADTSFIRFDSKIDAQKQTIAITSKKFGDGVLHYAVDPANARHLSISGNLGKGELAFDMERINPDSFPMLTRGFHWINEYPYNR
jgi:hypothetical protein